MATIILSTVGSALGGPIGGAIGAIIGQQIDNRVFAPKGRKGPRLNELSVQTSAYGSPIPKLFGTNRVAGTVVWATDLKETTRRVSNGKGQPKSTVYSYSSSFAVLLSARRILRVERIWADGNLLRGAAGDFKTETGFRLYSGDETQAADPLIASAQGIGMTPAYRGQAYAVFEDFQLGDYGNRIPSLSFEVFAEEEAVALGDVATALSDETVTANWPATVDGVAVTGESLRGLIETFSSLTPVYARQTARTLHLSALLPPPEAINIRDLGSAHDSERMPRVEFERRPASALPPRISVAHYEPSRDYQQGLQRADGIGGTGRELRVDLPATLGAEQVKARAAEAARREWSERTTARIRLPWRALPLTTATAVQLPDDSRVWRVASVTLERMMIAADLVLHAPPMTFATPSDGGSGILQPDFVHGPTVFHVLDLPPLDGTVSSEPRIAIAAAGASAGWRRANLLVSTDAGASWEEAGSTAAPATMGNALNALPAASSHLRDAVNTLEVELLSSGMGLANAGIDALDSGANAALLGREVIQFQAATPIGPRRFALTGLLRGRRGTEWAMTSHLAGERFVLLEPVSLAPLTVTLGTPSLQVMAVGVGDLVPPVRSLDVIGEAILPPTVVRLSSVRASNGDTSIRWVRRSRNGWRWLDGADAPLIEEIERYRMTFIPNAGVARSIEVATDSYVYPASERAADIAAGASVMTISVAQLGTYGASRSIPITILLS